MNFNRVKLDAPEYEEDTELCGGEHATMYRLGYA